MDNKKLFMIGEVAKMFHISMGTLRHYEKAGLLRPEYIDEKTGYRYYGVNQLEVLNTIRYLRVLDFSLPDIADFINNRDIDVMEEKLVIQKRIIEEKQRELERISSKLEHRLKQLQDAKGSELDVIKVETTPAIRIVRIEDSLELKTYLDLEYSIRKIQENQKEALAFLGKVGVGISGEMLTSGEYDKYNVVFLVLDDEDYYQGEVETLPEQKSVVIRFCGGHEKSPVYYERLMKYIRDNNMSVSGFSREITLIDYGMTNDIDKFVTEIRIPVE